MAEITQTGVTGKTLYQYRDEITGEYLEIDPAWNVLPESPDGQIIAIWAETLANLDEQVQYAYMSRDPATATGQALEDIAAYAGIERIGATYSTATITITGVNGTVVPAGSRVRNRITKSVWATDSTVEINGQTTVNVTASDPGFVSASQGELTEIVDPRAGWQSATNEAAAAAGRDIESDNDLRLRRDASVANPGQNQVDSIAAGVGNIDGVSQVRIYENPEDEVDSNGLAGHSIAIFVQGGGVQDVANAIAIRKNPGCGMNRNSSIPNSQEYGTTTPLGNPLDITFFRPDLVSIFVSVEISGEALDESDRQKIKNAIVDFSINGLQGQGSGFTRRGFLIGEKISAGRLYTPVNEIVGSTGFVESISVGSTSPASATSVTIGFNELGVFNSENIEVVYV